MKVLGLVTEYNPFHNGHLIHMEKSRDITGCSKTIVVMSGNFVQRGEPALLNKMVRTEMALKAGADMVIELPIYYATASAESFAWGAMKILDATGIVTDICFGSESGEISKLKSISQILANEDDIFKNNIKNYLNKGISYPLAREKALNDTMGFETNILNSPNNILAIEYLKSLEKIDSDINAHTIKREVSGYHSKEITENISSATAIRLAISNKEYEKVKNVMPAYAFKMLYNEIENGNAPHILNDYSQIFQYVLRRKNTKDLEKIEDITEGLENRIVNQLEYAFEIDEMVKKIKTKRYTFTKIQRAILHIILGITKDDIKLYNEMGGPRYIRILGFRKESQNLLREIEEKGKLPLIMNLKNAEIILENDKYAMNMLKKETEATDIYFLSGNAKENRKRKDFEYTEPIVIL